MLLKTVRFSWALMWGFVFVPGIGVGHTVAAATNQSLVIPWVPNTGQWDEAVAYQISANPITAYVTRDGQLV